MAAEKSNKRKKDVYKQENNLKFTKFKASPAINQKNYYTDYLKRDTQLLVNRVEKPSKLDQEKIFVMVPGSRNIQVGMIEDTEPQTLPMCVARKHVKTEPKKKDLDDDGDSDFEGEAEMAAYEKVERDFAERMDFYKREVDTNGLKTVQSFNSRQEPKESQIHKEFASEADLEVCNLQVDPSLYTLKWPIQHGTFNESYDTVQQLYGDLSLIFEHLIFKILKLSKNELEEYACVLVIPDLYEQAVVHAYIDLLVRYTGIGKIAVVQEAMAATFGVGLSTACIVSVGAQTTSISCIDEGMSMLDSRINLKYGGDDITQLFVQLLKRVEFPVNLDLTDPIDYAAANALKKQLCTANDEAIAVHTESFIYSRPKSSQQYEFKIYNEVMLPILGLFYPEILFDTAATKLQQRHRLVPAAENIYDGRYDDPISDAQLNCLFGSTVFGDHGKDSDYRKRIQVKDDEDEESRQATPVPSEGRAVSAAKETAEQQIAAEEADIRKATYVPLDKAIIQSIYQIAERNGSSAKNFFENILVIGGGAAHFPGFDKLLADRLGMWTNKKFPDFEEPAIMALPKELDASTVAWKGASVFAKLESIDKLWIENADWETLGARVLQYKTLFAF